MSWDLTANQEQEQWVQWLDTMANPHFQELELSHSNFMYKGVASLLPSAVTVHSWSNKGEDGEDHKPKAKQQRQHPYLPVHYHTMRKTMTFCSFNSKI